MADTGSITISFAALLKSYKKYNELPTDIREYMDKLNKDIPPGKPKNTPCCFQMSLALNGAGHRVYPHSHRRPNTRLGSDYYLGAVDELEAYLNGRYGKGEEIKHHPSGRPRTREEMKAYLHGKRGILVFRDHGAGAHTELWNLDTIIQKEGGPGGMNEGYIFKQPKVLFWAAVEQDPNPVPTWLEGWWTVNDGNVWYYYFSGQHGVSYTKTAPKGPGAKPTAKAQNEGTVTVSPLSSIAIEWASGTRETFVLSPTGEMRMRGVSSRYAPLMAVKMG